MSINNSYENVPKTGDIKQIVILLHGLGSNGQDLISLSPHWRGLLPDTVFVSPDAPYPCDMMPLGYPNSYQWFSLQDRDPYMMLRGVQEVFPVLEEFIDAQLKRFFLQHRNLALVGFSQGTMLGLYAAPRLKGKIAGVLGYSGALLWEGEEGLLHKPPVHLIHGDADNVVPVGAWHHARETLLQNGFEVSGYTTPMLTHSIDMDGIQSGGAFLKKVLI